MPTNCIAIDPGPEKSAIIIWDGKSVYGGSGERAFYEDNSVIIDWLRIHRGSGLPLIIEKVASFGMPVGAEVFETVWWSGRFAEAYGIEHVHRITRMDVKMHLCHSSRAKDANIRAALIDRFGKSGTKKAPGALYGITGDLWAALAVAVTYWDAAQGLV